MKYPQCTYACPVRINQRANSLQVVMPEIVPFRLLIAIATVLLLLIGGICSCSGDKREEQTKKEVKIEKHIQESEKNQRDRFIDSPGSEEAQNREKEKEKEAKEEKSIQEPEKNQRAQFIDSIEHHYDKLVSSYENDKWHQASAQLKLFKKYDRLDYKDVNGFARKMRIRELERAVKKIPVARFTENLRIYEQLLSLDPVNSRYKKKVAFYRAKLDEKKPGKEEDKAIRDFSRVLKIVNQDWKIEALRILAKWRVQVQNLSSSSSFKDIEFKTLYWDESGKRIDESIFGHTEHTIIKPKSKIWIEFSELVSLGVKKATVQIVKATRVE